MGENLIKSEAAVLNPENYNLESIWDEDIKHNRELFDVLDKKGAFERIKNAYMKYLDKMKKQSPDQATDEEEFWNKVNKLPWDKQKKVIFFRYNRDYNIPELSPIRRDYNLYAMKKQQKQQKPKKETISAISTQFTNEK